MKIVLRGKNIVHHYGTVEVLKGVDVEVRSGELLSIVGRSGAGKSTLLHILGTLLTPSSGEIEFAEQNLSGLSDKKLSAFRAKNIGFVFQEHHLLPEFTALENVALAGAIAGSSTADRDAIELLDRLGLGHRKDHKPAALSGGEQQRVAVARALVNRPMVVFADEPTGNLDSKARRELNALFSELRNELGQTFVIVTHENELAEMCDRKIVISDGEVE